MKPNKAIKLLHTSEHIQQRLQYKIAEHLYKLFKYAKLETEFWFKNEIVINIHDYKKCNLNKIKKQLDMMIAKKHYPSIHLYLYKKGILVMSLEVKKLDKKQTKLVSE